MHNKVIFRIFARTANQSRFKSSFVNISKRAYATSGSKYITFYRDNIFARNKQTITDISILVN